MKITVADLDFRANEEMAACWHGTGGWFVLMQRQIGKEMAYSIMLSRISRELRRDYGLDEAKKVLRDVADTMDQVSEADC